MQRNLLPKTILIYLDEGVNRWLARICRASLRKIYPSFEVRFVNSDFVKKNLWEKNCALFVIPGGRSRPYYNSLTTVGFDKIRKYVEEGGFYLGICAGAYFGAAFTEFEKGHALEILKEGPLHFFEGKAIGPAYGSGQFRYNSQVGARIALLEWNYIQGLESYYFNGGCFFENATNFANVKVIARYADIESKPAAIILCQVGKGKALLSGIHLEGAALGRFYFKLKFLDKQRRATFQKVLDG